MTSEYRPSPFNYCDYRCERCDEKEHCRVYRDNEERILKHYIKGEDLYDPDIFFKDVEEIFKKTKNMIDDTVKKQGISIEEASDGDIPLGDPKNYKIYQLALEYFREANRFIKTLKNTGIPHSINEHFQDLVWYHTLIVAKVARLVSGFIDNLLEKEMQKKEEEGTVSVINKGIMSSKDALRVMLNELPDHLLVITDLMNVLQRFEKQLHTDMRQKTY